MTTYTVFIRWEPSDQLLGSSDGAWQVPIEVKAESPEDAAQRRVGMLYSAEGYASVAVLVPADSDDVMGDPEIRIFDIVPQARYGVKAV